VGARKKEKIRGGEMEWNRDLSLREVSDRKRKEGAN